MFFYFRRKKLIVDTFTSHPGVYNLFPIKESKYFLPSWFKDLPSKYNSLAGKKGPTIEVPTIKRCHGIIELYQQGFIIPLWCDLTLETDRDGTVSWFWNSSNFKSLIRHDREQFGEKFDNLIHSKIQSPWKIKEKTGAKFLFNNIFYENPDHINKIFVPPGVLDFKYQNNSHINLFFNKQANKLTLEAGRPIVQLIPISDQEIIIKNHLLSDQEFDQLEKEIFVFTSSGYYSKRKKILDNKKCPFKG